MAPARDLGRSARSSCSRCGAWRSCLAGSTCGSSTCGPRRCGASTCSTCTGWAGTCRGTCRCPRWRRGSTSGGSTGPHGRAADNIYRQKFEAYYGRQITSSAPDENYMVRSESLFPVFLATAVLAVGWAAVLWDTRFVTDPVRSVGRAEVRVPRRLRVRDQHAHPALLPERPAPERLRHRGVPDHPGAADRHRAAPGRWARPPRWPASRARHRLRRRLLPARRPAGPAAGDVPGAVSGSSRRSPRNTRSISSTGSTCGTRRGSPKRASRTCRTSPR